MTCSMEHADGCRACGKKLKGRQKSWCSTKCRSWFYANHRWTQARARARQDVAYYLCARAVSSADGMYGPEDCEVFTQRPEVNHIVPCKGKHGEWGCHHHQSNLEVLCPPCHKRETARQRKEGLL